MTALLTKKKECVIPEVRFPGYAIRKLALTNFRNYEELKIELDSHPVALFGPNGAGKTNVLEAVSLLSPGRGFRQARYDDIIRNGVTTGWTVSARLQSPRVGGDHTIGTGIMSDRCTENSSRRTVQIDSQKRSVAALAEVINISWLTPQMDRLFQGGSASRRRFIDRLVYSVDTAHARRVVSYDRSLRERSRALRSGIGTNEWLDAIEKSIAKSGVEVALARKDVVALLGEKLAENRGPFPGALVEVEGTLEGMLVNTGTLDVEAHFKRKLRETRLSDAESNRTAFGPHRSDLRVYHLEKGLPAVQCSTGEQKALLIAIILADARISTAHHGGAPVLLLDEIAAHLDLDHLEALFAELRTLSIQAWLTATDISVFGSIAGEAQILQIVDGGIRSIRSKSQLIQRAK